MTHAFIYLSLIVTSYAFTIKSSDKDSTDLFPDWVPFKNKHGDELGEFEPVQQKSKIKKRLALPVNFVLKAVADPEGDDYFEKGLGENDSDDYFEKKEWSDLHRPAKPVEKVVLNHTDLSNIDGVVDIITKKTDNPIVIAINKVQKEVAEAPEDTKNLEKFATDVLEDASSENKNETKRDEIENSDNDEDVETTTHQPTEQEIENEKRKALILSSVDELKERHAQEQREISDKYFTDDENIDRQNVSNERTRSHRNRKVKKNPPPDYDEYEDKNVSLEDKYKINPAVVKVTDDYFPTESSLATSTRTTQKPIVHDHETGKLSVFRNPQAYMMYDDDETTQPTRKYSSKYVTKADDDDERISLIPAQSKEGEPTLFFPKKKNKRRKTKNNKKGSTTPDVYTKTFTEDTTPFDTTASDSQLATTAIPEYFAQDVTGEESSYKLEAATTDSIQDVDDNVKDTTDVLPEASDHVKAAEEKDFRTEKGGGKEHFSEHEEEHEEHAKKAYKGPQESWYRKEYENMKTNKAANKPWYLQYYILKGHHEDKKTAKGYHDKEDHLGKYDDHGGVDKRHEEESAHYGKHHHEEQGKKHAKYEESGKHSKGHSTKGSHDIHKKEEYEKKVEFFEEDGDSGEEEKFGGFHNENKHEKGGHFKKGNLKADHHSHNRGESGDYGKGGFSNNNKGHKSADGHDGHGKHGNFKYNKEAKDSAKKWVYHHGYPAKTANLVIIDRRADQYHHAPFYFG